MSIAAIAPNARPGSMGARLGAFRLAMLAAVIPPPVTPIATGSGNYEEMRGLHDRRVRKRKDDEEAIALILIMME